MFFLHPLMIIKNRNNPVSVSKDFVFIKWNTEGIRQHLNQWFVRRNVQNRTYGIPLNDLITGVDEYIFWFDYAYKKSKENHKEVIKEIGQVNYYTDKHLFLRMSEDGVKLFKDRLEEMQEFRSWIDYYYGKRSRSEQMKLKPKFKHIWWMQDQESLEYCVDTEKEIVECA